MVEVSHFPTPPPWKRNTGEVKRDEKKRLNSPCSFFYSQGRALVLAAEYFTDERLVPRARSGVAGKHRHRIQLALFGQLMASFEYMLKDFVAQVLEATNLYDEKVQAAKWIEIDASTVLAFKVAPTTVGSLLVHSTMGWHSPQTVNERYKTLFRFEPITRQEIPTLERLWLLRHSVAHNAGFVIAHDAARLGSSELSEKVVAIDDQFISDSFKFLAGIAERTANGAGGSILDEWLETRVELGPDITRDRDTYKRLKLLATFVPSRPKDLPRVRKRQYSADFARVKRACS